MNLPRLGSAVIVNNLASDVPETAQDLKALRSTLETIGFDVKSNNGLNALVMFQNIFGLIQESLGNKYVFQ